jgi:predicted RNA-binding protein
MDKKTLISNLRKFARQRPGLEFGNYGDAKAYRAEMRAITRDLAHAETLLLAVKHSDGISAQDILDASRSAFSGRLEIDADTGRISYTTGQYFPTEYRKAVCAVLASALWARFRECMRNDTINGQSPGDRIRAHFRREFGRAIASRYFN